MERGAPLAVAGAATLATMAGKTKPDSNVASGITVDRDQAWRIYEKLAPWAREVLRNCNYNYDVRGLLKRTTELEKRYGPSEAARIFSDALASHDRKVLAKSAAEVGIEDIIDFQAAQPYRHPSDYFDHDKDL